MRRLGPAILLFFAAASAAEAEERAYRVVNVVDDFLAYHRLAKDADAAGRAALWDEVLEKRHPTFFADALYRRKEGEEREAYKRTCIARFFEEVAPRIGEIAERNEGIEEVIHRVVDDARQHLPEFEPATDFYVTIAFSFRGKALDVGGEEVLAIGLEAFTEPGMLSLEITIAHELFHLHHFAHFPAGGGLYRLLWSEGLATYASAVVVPGHRRSAYLGFPVEKMNRCAELLPALAGDLAKHLGENDHRLKRIYFGAEKNDTLVPPEAGYYVGLLIAEHLARERSLAAMARLTPKEMLPVLARQLAMLAEED